LRSDGKAAGQEVFYWHTHIIPRFSNDAFRFNWQTEKYGEGEAATMGEAIRNAL
jgi:diadenosine tetraphosphate (Ap4A) HIT family hydrolase